MPGFLFHVGATAMCPHGAPVQTIPGSPRVLVSGQPVATMSDTYVITGCAFVVAGAPHPCVMVQWLVPAERVLVEGAPAILQSSAGLCLAPDSTPQGAPIVAETQMRVAGE